MKDQMLEMQKSNATTNNNYKDCAINNTQNININLFLNKDCKNAMNLEDFVDNIKVQLEDILYQGEVGAAEGYYAVGMAMQKPKSRILAFEMEDRVRHNLNTMKNLNGTELEVRAK